MAESLIHHVPIIMEGTGERRIFVMKDRMFRHIRSMLSRETKKQWKARRWEQKRKTLNQGLTFDVTPRIAGFFANGYGGDQ